jgi:hypothetical protein
MEVTSSPRPISPSPQAGAADAEHLPEAGNGYNLGAMNPVPGQPSPSIRFPPCLLLWAIVSLAACASAGPFVPDTTDKVPRPSAREGTDANDVFMRAPWEIWRTPHGPSRYHREAHVLLPTESEDFKAGEVSVYAADGSDVRVEYESIDLGAGSQSHETIGVSVYRLRTSPESEWSTAVERLRHKWPGATAAEPFPIPDKHPSSTRQMAMLVSANQPSPTFIGLWLFVEDGWAVRYEITCPADDMTVVRKKTLWFLRTLRTRE